MYHARHLKPHHWAAVAFALVAVLALVAGVAAVTGRLDGTGGTGGTADTAGTEGRAASASSSRTSSPEASATADNAAFDFALAQCRAAWSRQARALEAADSSLDQWGVHIGAMNKLVAGEITPDQASKFWAASRTGAAQRVAEYQAIDEQTLGAFRRCSRPAVADTDSADLRRLDACRTGAFARDDVLVSARTAIGTWEHHIHDMEALRAGKLSPTVAMQKWMANWRKGNAQLRHYRHERSVAGDISSC